MRPPIDWQQERQNFPAVQNGTYLMTAAIGPISTATLKAARDHLEALNQNGEVNPPTLIEHLERTRQLATEYLNATSADHIAFVPNASHGMNVIASLLKRQHPGGEILLSEDEFPTSTVPWYHHGFQVRQVPVDHLAASIRPHTRAVVCSAVQFASGYRTDLMRLGEHLDAQNIPFIVNATQALGAFATPVKEAKISALTGSCHKWFCAGYGVALLYLAPSFSRSDQAPFAGWMSVRDPFAMLNNEPALSPTARVHELGTLPFSSLAAVEASFKNISRLGLDQISHRVWQLSGYLEEELRRKDFKILSPRDQAPDVKSSINSGTLAVEVPQLEEKVAELAREKIYVTARRGAMRIATHYYNNQEDIERLLSFL